MSDEKVFERAAELEEHRRQEAIKKRVQYKNFSKVCTWEDCGEPLPECRQDIGICLECAEDLQRINDAKKRNGG